MIFTCCKFQKIKRKFLYGNQASKGTIGVATESNIEVESYRDQSGTVDKKNKPIEIFDGTTDIDRLFADPEAVETINLKTFSEQIRRIRDADKRFYQDLAKILTSKGVTGFPSELASIHQVQNIDIYIMAETLIEYINTPLVFLLLTREQKNFVFNILKLTQQHQKIIELAESSEVSKDSSFIEQPFIQECIADAYFYGGLPFYASGDPGKCADGFEKGEAILKKIVATSKSKRSVASAYAKTGEYYYKLGEMIAGKGDVPRKSRIAQELFVSGLAYLEQAYAIDFNGMTGAKLLTVLIKAASLVEDEKAQIALTHKCLELVKIVHLSVIKSGGFESHDFTHLSTFLKTYAIFTDNLPPEMDNTFYEVILKKILDCKPGAEELESLIKDLENLNQDLGKLPGHNTSGINIRNIRSILAYCVLVLRGEKKLRPRAIDSSIWRKGFYYTEENVTGGSGNTQYNGQLHPHVVSEWDFDIAENIIHDQQLNKITNFDEFNKKINALLRARFGTAELEDLHSPEHQEHDAFMKNLLKIMGIQKLEDARTNVMVDFFLGEGDCRQHAYIKALLFAAWRKIKVNEYLAERLRLAALPDNEKDLVEVERLQQKYYKEVGPILLSHMLVVDLEILADIEHKGKYTATKDADGYYRKGNGVVPQEDHTLNIRVEMDRTDLGKDMITIEDTFYHNKFPFSRVQIPSTIPVDDGGNFQINVGDIKVKDASDGIVPVPIIIRPLRYAGDRSTPRARAMVQDIIGTVPQLRGIDLLATTSPTLWGQTRPASIEKFVKQVAGYS